MVAGVTGGVSRRAVMVAAAAAATAAAMPARAAGNTLRIGVQKYGTLIILRERHTLEPALLPGWNATWHEFVGGPQLLEALAAGAVDFGTTGEAPPIFSQAAGASLFYVGFEPPSPAGEAILVPQDSPIRMLTDLKGKRVALNKGSNVHYLLVRALAKAGLSPADILPTYLAPADARAAFERGSVDAWAIWDPFLAVAQAATNARTLADGTGLAPNRQFFLATRSFVQEHPDVLAKLTAEIAGADRWAATNQAGATDLLAASLKLPAPVIGQAVGRMGYGVHPMTPEVTAEQQKIADTFHALGLIPQAIDVSSAVWSPS
jgi:sulfonate transport system substrate-binding protein